MERLGLEISFPDCEHKYVENDYHNSHSDSFKLDVFQILDINLSESQFLDTQLDNDCFILILQLIMKFVCCGCNFQILVWKDNIVLGC